jgi:hypothetical protein
VSCTDTARQSGGAAGGPSTSGRSGAHNDDVRMPESPTLSVRRRQVIEAAGPGTLPYLPTLTHRPRYTKKACERVVGPVRAPHRHPLALVVHTNPPLSHKHTQ